MVGASGGTSEEKRLDAIRTRYQHGRIRKIGGTTYAKALSDARNEGKPYDAGPTAKQIRSRNARRRRAERQESIKRQQQEGRAAFRLKYSKADAARYSGGRNAWFYSKHWAPKVGFRGNKQIGTYDYIGAYEKYIRNKEATRQSRLATSRQNLIARDAPAARSALAWRTSLELGRLAANPPQRKLDVFEAKEAKTQSVKAAVAARAAPPQQNVATANNLFLTDAVSVSYTHLTLPTILLV